MTIEHWNPKQTISAKSNSSLGGSSVTGRSTLRAGCLDHLGTMTSLHDVHARLLAFLDEHYHRSPHGGLFLRSREFLTAYREARASWIAGDEMPFPIGTYWLRRLAHVPLTS